MPTCTWFPGLFNPMAFLTALMQVTGRVRGFPLDNMTTETHVTMMHDSSKAVVNPEDGLFAIGLFIEGGRWGGYDDEDEGCVNGEPDLYEVTGVACGGHICDAQLFDLMPRMPRHVLFKAVTVRPESGAHK